MGMAVAMRRSVTPPIFLRSGPPAVVSTESRRRPDRRWKWRGGRRDNDWTKRPFAARRAPAVGQWLYRLRRWTVDRMRRYVLRREAGSETLNRLRALRAPR